MLNKKSGLSYCKIRERYEHFRSKCTLTTDNIKTIIKKVNKTRKKRKRKRLYRSFVWSQI